jgi:hypothetical protein
MFTSFHTISYFSSSSHCFYEACLLACYHFGDDSKLNLAINTYSKKPDMNVVNQTTKRKAEVSEQMTEFMISKIKFLCRVKIVAYGCENCCWICSRPSTDIMQQNFTVY